MTNINAQVMGYFHKEWRTAVDASDYIRGMIISTAEDLFDQLSKGIPVDEGRERVLAAFSANKKFTQDATEIDTWNDLIAYIDSTYRI